MKCNNEESGTCDQDDMNRMIPSSSVSESKNEVQARKDMAHSTEDTSFDGFKVIIVKNNDEPIDRRISETIPGYPRSLVPRGISQHSSTFGLNKWNMNMVDCENKRTSPSEHYSTLATKSEHIRSENDMFCEKLFPSIYVNRNREAFESAIYPLSTCTSCENELSCISSSVPAQIFEDDQKANSQDCENTDQSGQDREKVNNSDHNGQDCEKVNNTDHNGQDCEKVDNTDHDGQDCEKVNNTDHNGQDYEKVNNTDHDDQDCEKVKNTDHNGQHCEKVNNTDLDTADSPQKPDETFYGDVEEAESIVPIINTDGVSAHQEVIVEGENLSKFGNNHFDCRSQEQESKIDNDDPPITDGSSEVFEKGSPQALVAITSNEHSFAKPETDNGKISRTASQESDSLRPDENESASTPDTEAIKEIFYRLKYGDDFNNGYQTDDFEKAFYSVQSGRTTDPSKYDNEMNVNSDIVDIVDELSAIYGSSGMNSRDAMEKTLPLFRRTNVKTLSIGKENSENSVVNSKKVNKDVVNSATACIDKNKNVLCAKLDIENKSGPANEDCCKQVSLNHFAKINNTNEKIISGSPKSITTAVEQKKKNNFEASKLIKVNKNNKKNCSDCDPLTMTESSNHCKPDGSSNDISRKHNHRYRAMFKTAKRGLRRLRLDSKSRKVKEKKVCAGIDTESMDMTESTAGDEVMESVVDIKMQSPDTTTEFVMTRAANNSTRNTATSSKQKKTFKLSRLTAILGKLSIKRRASLDLEVNESPYMTRAKFRRICSESFEPSSHDQTEPF